MGDAIILVFSLFVLVGAIQQFYAYRRRGIRADWKKLPAVIAMAAQLLLGIIVVFAAAFGIGRGLDVLGLGDFAGVLAFLVALGGLIGLFIWYSRRAAKFKWWRRV